MRRRRILFVASGGSSHTAGWIQQLTGTGWDVHLVSSWELNGVCPELPGVTVHCLGPCAEQPIPEGTRVTGQWPFSHGGWRASAVHRYLRAKHRAYLLARTIRRIRPDIVHTLEMQHSAYLLLDAVKRYRLPSFRWVYSSWGSDIAHFSHFPAHAGRIREVLAQVEYHISDCKRDLELARDYGFIGVSLGVAPGRGGIDVELLRSKASEVSSSRRLVLVKGYQSEEWGGRALNILAALGRITESLKGVQVRIFSATPDVVAVVKYMRATTDLDIAVIPQIPNGELLEYMGQARLVVACGTTDGTPNAMLEAMIMGALPVQSDAGASGEWIKNGRNGLLVQPEDIDGIAQAISVALEDAQLVDSAAIYNLTMMLERVDVSVVQPRVLEWYRRVLSSSAANG